MSAYQCTNGGKYENSDILETSRFIPSTCNHPGFASGPHTPALGYDEYGVCAGGCELALNPVSAIARPSATGSFTISFYLWLDRTLNNAQATDERPIAVYNSMTQNVCTMKNLFFF